MENKENQENQKKQERLKKWEDFRNWLYVLISPGTADDPASLGYDIFSAIILILNLTATVALTFDSVALKYYPILRTVETCTVLAFAVDFVFRIITAQYFFPGLTEAGAVAKYVFSTQGIVDILSFLPYGLPFFFPEGAAAFRMIRIARIFRLFRINTYYDSLHVITDVLYNRKNQLLSSIFLLSVLMTASSLCMYSLEHEAQPEVFSNAFSGIWWSVSTLLTVGYGDIYPVTFLGKVFGIIISCLGVGMVAIPTGIISAGFVEQYSELKRIGEYGDEADVHYVEIRLGKRDPWAGLMIGELGLPRGLIVAMVEREREALLPKDYLMLQAGDKLIIAAEAIKHDNPIRIKEMLLRKNHPWVGKRIKDLDISRQTYIVMVQRDEAAVIPRADLVLAENDVLMLYKKVRLNDRWDV